MKAAYNAFWERSFLCISKSPLPPISLPLINRPARRIPISSLIPYGDPSGAQPPQGGLRAWAVVLIALGTFFLGIFTGIFLSAFSMAASEISDNSWSQYDDPYNSGAAHSYGLNETAGVSGTLYDLSFSACSFDADVTLTSYLRGDQAADKILGNGRGSKRPARWNGICDSDLSN